MCCIRLIVLRMPILRLFISSNLYLQSPPEHWRDILCHDVALLNCFNTFLLLFQLVVLCEVGNVFWVSEVLFAGILVMEPEVQVSKFPLP